MFLFLFQNNREDKIDKDENEKVPRAFFGIYVKRFDERQFYIVRRVAYFCA